MLAFTGCGNDSPEDIFEYESANATYFETEVPMEITNEDSPNHYTRIYNDDFGSFVEEDSYFFEIYFYEMAQLQDAYFYFSLFHTHGLDGYESIHFSLSPLEGLKAMYRELNSQFNYILIHTHSFDYIGYFNGYEKFITNPASVNITEIRNQQFTDRSGYEILVTPLNGIQMGRMLYRYFEHSIARGRNFDEYDFYIDSPDDVVNIILGFDYMGIYDIGDIIKLELYAGTKAFNFRVIGFYEEGTNFPHMNEPFGEIINFDRSIVMPFFEINYEPIDELNRQFQTILYSNKTSGNIRIMDSFYSIIEMYNEAHPLYLAVALYETRARYWYIVEEMANRHNLGFDIPLLPIPRPRR